MSYFITNFRPLKPIKLSNQPWLNPEEPQVILFQGICWDMFAHTFFL